MGNRLRELRESKGISQRKLAEKTGIDHTVLSKIETGKVRLASHHLAILAPALQCRPEDIVADDEPLSALDREFLEAIRAYDEPQVRQIIAMIRALRS